MKEIRWRVFCNGFHHWTISVSFIITISRSHWSRGFERFCASPPSTTFLWTSAINSFIQESVSHWTHTPEHLSSSSSHPQPPPFPSHGTMAGGCALHYTACTNTPCSTARFHCSEHVLVLVHRLIPSNKRSLKKRQSVSLKIRHFHALFFFIYFCFLSSFPIPIVTNQCGPRVCEVQLTPLV